MVVYLCEFASSLLNVVVLAGFPGPSWSSARVSNCQTLIAGVLAVSKAFVIVCLCET